MPVPTYWSEQLREFVARLKADPDRPLGDEPFDRFVLTEQATSWAVLLRWLKELEGSWCFRGQREAGWRLHTHLDRAVLVEHKSRNSTGYYHLDREAEERDLLFRFQQRAHQYIQNLPSGQDRSSWLALMQHHGVPTRFLDWTKSPYVAMFFALEETDERTRRSAVWAIDLDWVETKGRELFPSEPMKPDPDPQEKSEIPE